MEKKSNVSDAAKAAAAKQAAAAKKAAQAKAGGTKAAPKQQPAPKAPKKQPVPKAPEAAEEVVAEVAEAPARGGNGLGSGNRSIPWPQEPRNFQDRRF